MDLEACRVALDVVRRGSFAAVARDRDTDPSTISRTVAGLERALGLRLFQRSTRRLALTEAGAHFVAKVEPLLDELSRVGEEARGRAAAPAGTLRLTTSVAFGQVRVVPLLPAFRRACPALRVELLLTDANLDLVADRVDLAIRLAPRVEQDYVAARLLRTRYRVVVSPGYLRHAPALRLPTDLSAHRCLLSALPDYRSRWRFRAPDGTIAEIAVDGDVVTTNALALRDCALAGSGPALLADWLIGDDLAAGRLVDPFPDRQATATDFDTSVWLVYPSRAWVPAKVRAAITVIRDGLSGAG